MLQCGVVQQCRYYWVSNLPGLYLECQIKSLGRMFRFKPDNMSPDWKIGKVVFCYVAAA